MQVVSLVAQLQDGEGILHVARGHPDIAPRLAVRLPSLSAPLPATTHEFASMHPGAGVGAGAGESGLSEGQQAQFQRDGYLLLKGFYSPVRPAFFPLPRKHSIHRSALHVEMANPLNCRNTLRTLPSLPLYWQPEGFA